MLPVIARNSSAVAEQLVRDAINDCRRNGINEWHNNDYCSNCNGEVVTTPRFVQLKERWVLFIGKTMDLFMDFYIKKNE